MKNAIVGILLAAVAVISVQAQTGIGGVKWTLKKLDGRTVDAAWRVGRVPCCRVLFRRATHPMLRAAGAPSLKVELVGLIPAFAWRRCDESVPPRPGTRRPHLLGSLRARVTSRETPTGPLGRQR